MAKLLAAAALILTISLVSTPAPASAQTEPAPDVEHGLTACYRSLIETDDLFCLTRYELPTSLTDNPSSPEAWCAVLVDPDGCTGQPVNPTDPTSLTSRSALLTLYSGPTLVAQVLAPRVGHSVAGHYLAAGHGVTWGDASVQVCVESSPALFSTTTSDCRVVFWNSADNTQEAQRAAFESQVLSTFQVLEGIDELIPPSGYVLSGQLTGAAAVLALEAFGVIQDVIPDIFLNASRSLVDTPFATPVPGSNQIQTDINATATAVIGQLNGLSADLGAPPEWIGIGIFTAFGLVVFGAVMRVTQGNQPFAVVAFLTTVLTGTLVGFVPVMVMAIAALLIGAVGVLYVLRKQVFA